MSDFPTPNFFTYVNDPTHTNSSRLAKLDEFVAACKHLQGALPETAVALDASGIAAVDRFFTRVDTLGGTASDNMDGISAPALPAGRLVAIRIEDSSRQVTLRHAQGSAGTNQLSLLGGTNFTLTTTTSIVYFLKFNSNWFELYRYPGNDKVGWRTLAGLTAVSTYGIASSAELHEDPPTAASRAVDLLGLADVLYSAQSDPLTIGNTAADVWVHGLGITPRTVEGYLIKKSNNTVQGYGPGRTVPLASVHSFSPTLAANATDVAYAFAGSKPFLAPKSGGAPFEISPTDWDFVIRVKRW